jgi:hypothetical protein
MENYGLNIKYNEEVKIGQFIFNFIKILNSILNEVVINVNDVEKNKKIDKGLVYLSDKFEFENLKEEVILNKILEVYSQRISSLISRNFMNVIKTKKKCMSCNTERNSFRMSNYIPFNIKILTKNFGDNNLNIKSGFKCLLDKEKILNEQKGIFCEKCNKITVHKESKSFYHTARNLIIILNRGENCGNKTFIDFDETLVLREEVERYYEIQYQLVGIIEEDGKGNYISFTRDENNLWHDNGDKKKVIKFEDTKHKGTVVALFFYCDNENMTLKYNSLYSHQFLNLSSNVNFYNPNNMIYQNAIYYMNQFNFNYYHYYMSIPNFSGQNWNMNYNNNFQMHN